MEPEEPEDEADVVEDLARALERIDPAYGYAVRKLGYAVTDANIDLMTREQRHAWDEALEEYLSRESGDD